MKKEWQQFGLKVAAWAAAALAAQFLTTIFLGGPLPYVVPGLLALGALQIGMLDRTPLPAGGAMLKRGVALLMITFAVWLGTGPGADSKISWQVYSDELLNVARQSSRPVMIDFTRRNCPPCADMEQHVFSNRRVANAAKDFLALRVDCTPADARVERLETRFGVQAYPTLIFIGGDGKEHSNLRLVGYENATFFRERLERAR